MDSKKTKSVTGKAFDVNLLKRIYAYVKPIKKYFFLSVFISILFAFLSPIRPLLVQYTVDHYIIIPHAGMLLKMTLLLVGFLELEGILQFVDTYMSAWIGQSVIKKLRVELYGHIIKLRLKYFDNTPIGVLVTRSVSDIETIADIFSEGIVVIMGDILKLTVIIGVMFYTNVKMSLITLSIMPILLISANIFKNAVKASFQDVRNQVAHLNGFVQEHITGMGVVQIFNREETELQKFKEINQAHRDANIRSIWYYSVFFPVVEILSSVAIALLIWTGGKSVIGNTASLGEIMAFIMYINMLFRPIRQLADRFNTLQMGMVGSERVFKLLDTKEFIDDKGTASADTITGDIEFKNVWFAYNDEDWILKNLSIKIKTGETIALVGATGAGKSSIVNLVNRFYEYNKGSISIDGKNVRDYSLSSLRKNIAFVPQDVFLFSDSILNNISLNNAEITKEKIIEAGKMIGAHEFISALPGDYNFDVKERGALLSVGQRQLISFIRAYVHDPRILILDEATSSIDTESEVLIQRAIEKLTQNRTSIIVAHRLATIKKADKIIVLDKGELLEIGTHDELIRLNGQYKKLFELQFKSDHAGTV